MIPPSAIVAVEALMPRLDSSEALMRVILTSLIAHGADAESETALRALCDHLVAARIAASHALRVLNSQKGLGAEKGGKP